MKQFFYPRFGLWAILLFAAGLSGCELETLATGRVVNSQTGAPVVNAHVMEIAVLNKSVQLLEETYTDSLGEFYMGGGLAGFGPRNVKLQLIVEKDSFVTATMENTDLDLNIELTPY